VLVCQYMSDRHAFMYLIRQEGDVTYFSVIWKCVLNDDENVHNVEVQFSLLHFTTNETASCTE
jgi:hypothetical protein